MRFSRSFKRIIKNVTRSPTTFKTFRINGASMTPGLRHGDRILIRSIVCPSSILRRRDVVIIYNPTSYKERYIKRIIGLPGEHVKIENERVHINGSPLEEPYLLDTGGSGDNIVSQWILPPCEYLVLGDNRNESRDSRQFGPIPSARIIGKSLFRYWPPGFFR